MRVTPRSLFTPRKDPVPIVQEAGWAPGPVWTSAENLAPTGIRSQDRPARSQSLYRLRYPAHEITCTYPELNQDALGRPVDDKRRPNQTLSIVCTRNAVLRK